MDTQQMIEHYALLTRIVQAAYDTVAAIKLEADQLEASIKKSVLDSGDSVEGSGYKFEYRKGSSKEVVEVDGEALVGYAVAHPEVQQFIKHITKVTKPTVALKKVG